MKRLALRMSSDHAAFALRLFRYKQRPKIFGVGNGGSWKETWLALYDDDTLLWYNDKHCTKICGRIAKFSTTRLSMLKVGRVADRDTGHLHPRRPQWSVPDEALYLAVPKAPGKTNEWQWFYMKKDSDLLTCLLHFAEAAGREREFRHLLEEYRVDDNHPQPFVAKYKRYGASLKGDLKHTVLREDLGVIWHEFIDSAPTTPKHLGHVNRAFAGLEPTDSTGAHITSIELSPQESVNGSILTPTDDSDLHDTGYHSGITTASASAQESCKDERSDSEPSADTVYSTTITVEIHSNKEA